MSRAATPMGGHKNVDTERKQSSSARRGHIGSSGWIGLRRMKWKVNPSIQAKTVKANPQGGRPALGKLMLGKITDADTSQAWVGRQRTVFKREIPRRDRRKGRKSEQGQAAGGLRLPPNKK